MTVNIVNDSLEEILTALFNPAKQILQRAINDIAKKNEIYIPEVSDNKFAPCKGFIYKDTVFISDEGSALALHPTNYKLMYKWYQLDKSLWDKFEPNYNLYLQIKKNEDIIPRFLVSLLRGCKTFSDIKNKLPDNICELIDLIGERKEPFTVPENLKPIWFMCKDDIEYLISMRLLL